MDKFPNSYTSLPYKQIRLSHVPNSSSTPTPVILVTLYCPGKHNAFTEVMTAELVDAFSLLSADDRVKAIVVTGHSNMFCAGADLDEAPTTGKDKLEGVESFLQKRPANFTETMPKDAWPWWKPIDTTIPGMKPNGLRLHGIYTRFVAPCPTSRVAAVSWQHTVLVAVVHDLMSLRGPT